MDEVEEAAGGGEAVVEESAGEAVVEGGGEAAADEPSFIDTVMGEEPPDSIRALDEAAERNGTDYKISADTFDAFPLEAKEFITNLRRMAVRRTQAAAQQQRDLDTLKQGLEQQRTQMNQEKAALLGMFNGNEKLQALLAEPDGEVSYDAFTPEGRRNLVAKEAREMFGEFFKTIAGVSDEYKQAAEAQIQQVKLNEEKAALKEFIGATPDWDELADQTKAYVKQGLHWKDAYLLARTKAGKPPPGEAPDPIAKSREEARRASRPGGRSSGTAPSLDSLVRNSGY